MATSGTISQTVFDTRRVIDHAFLRCKVPPQAITSEMIVQAQDALYLMLSDLPNRGVQLWTVDRQILPLYEGVAAIVTPAGTIDLLQANLRTLRRLTGTETVEASTRATDFVTAATPSTVGVLWSAPPAAFVVERSADGVTWALAGSYGAPSASAGQWTWVDLSALVPARYWRVRAPSWTLDASEVFWGTAPSEIPVTRMNRDAYDNLPNKTFPGRPLQYWLDRQVDVPVMNLWPVPNAASAYSQVTIRRVRHIMDVGSMQQTLEIPQRWSQTIVALLADVLAQQTPQVDPGVAGMLAGRAQEALRAVQGSEYDASTITFTPSIGVYNR